MGLNWLGFGLGPWRWAEFYFFNSSPSVLRIRIRDPVFFTPGSGIIFFPDPRSRIQPIFIRTCNNLLGKTKSVSIDSNLFCTSLPDTGWKKIWIRNTGHNLALNLFLFPSLLKITRFLYNRRSAVVSFRDSLIPSCLFYCTNTIGAAIFTPLTGESWRK
jgi:hypothetical protein